MFIDDSNWNPISLEELYSILKDFEIPWWVKGGWALDTFIGKKTREHGDTDIMILRRDQFYLQEKLQGWIFYRTKGPGLKLWKKGEYLSSKVNSIWAKRQVEEPFLFEISLEESKDDNWVYKRNQEIQVPIKELGLTTDWDMPYLKPQYELCYKLDREFRYKDCMDMVNVLPHMSKESIQWLYDLLKSKYGDHLCATYMEKECDFLQS